MSASSEGRCRQNHQILPLMLTFLLVPDKHVVWNANQAHSTIIKQIHHSSYRYLNTYDHFMEPRVPLRVYPSSFLATRDYSRTSQFNVLTTPRNSSVMPIRLIRFIRILKLRRARGVVRGPIASVHIASKARTKSPAPSQRIGRLYPQVWSGVSRSDSDQGHESRENNDGCMIVVERDR